MNNVYILEGPRFVVLGVFSSKELAEEKIKELPRIWGHFTEYDCCKEIIATYLLTEVPLDVILSPNGRTDKMGTLNHWHYGE